jgi:hypothetical protein
VLDFVPRRIESRIVQLTVIHDEMFIPVGMLFEILSGESIRLIYLAWRGNEHHILHLLEDLPICYDVPMLVDGIGLQILFVA